MTQGRVAVGWQTERDTSYVSPSICSLSTLGNIRGMLRPHTVGWRALSWAPETIRCCHLAPCSPWPACFHHRFNDFLFSKWCAFAFFFFFFELVCLRFRKGIPRKLVSLLLSLFSYGHCCATEDSLAILDQFAGIARTHDNPASQCQWKIT